MEIYLGKHEIIEYFDCDKDILNDIDKIEQFMSQAAIECKATIVEKCFHKFSPYGISGVVVIAESHLAIHTWPEHSYAAVDFFTCNKTCETKLAISYLQEKFKAKKTEIKTVKRGEFKN